MAWFDERSRRYAVSELLDAERPLRSKTWRCPIVLDQGRHGACTGFAVAHALAAEPVRCRETIDEAFARETIYRRAQQLDPYGGGTPTVTGRPLPGGTILAAAKVAHGLGLVAEYRWAFGLDDVLGALSQLGPVVLGLPWTEGMADPACCGMLHPTGRRTGAHAILARGIDVRRRTILLHNSFGRRWGDRGTARLHWDDLRQLLDRGREAEGCVLIARASVDRR